MKRYEMFNRTIIAESLRQAFDMAKADIEAEAAEDVSAGRLNEVPYLWASIACEWYCAKFNEELLGPA